MINFKIWPMPFGRRIIGKPAWMIVFALAVPMVRADDDSVRPFRIHIPEAQLADLRQHCGHTVAGQRNGI